MPNPTLLERHPLLVNLSKDPVESYTSSQTI